MHLSTDPLLLVAPSSICTPLIEKHEHHTVLEQHPAAVAISRNATILVRTAVCMTLGPTIKKWSKRYV
jgi:hypothetical protein